MPNDLAGPIELFHFLFLAALPPAEKGFAVLKGGGNLRFFFRSPRYSQDLDFDVPYASPESVQSAMTRALKSPPLLDGLRAHRIQIAEQTLGKQTDVTQRWRIALELRLEASNTVHQPARTKIEFSHRPELMDYLNDRQVDYVRDDIAARYSRRPPQALHYNATAAILQKLRALTERNIVQSRDVWYLEMLFREHPSNHVSERLNAGVFGDDAQRNRVLNDAIALIYELDFSAYQRQVVAFLDDGYADQYDKSNSWDHIQFSVVSAIERLRSGR